MSMLQKHCKEEEEEELAGDLSGKRTYFCHVFVRERHYWETHILHTQLKEAHSSLAKECKALDAKKSTRKDCAY